ncbi:hypothetical protein KSP39_PZI000629 [Platanthera zijinensis]|uniref:Tf2-1-like SH3-like domain-containing protein n=1 Tax=Platanthera zijinensis TaxID=2320716 RepID=A0AAP0C014_9ASPA
MSTAYHLQSDGQSEVLNRCLETYLRCFIGERPGTWVKWLCWAEYSYNTAYHLAANTTPFETVYGRAPPSITQYLPGECPVASLADNLQDRDIILDSLKHHLRRAQSKIVSFANRKRRDLTLQVGEKVFLKLQPYRELSVARRTCPKLAPRYYGPFEIISRIGVVAYRLRLPSGSRIHPVAVGSTQCFTSPNSDGWWVTTPSWTTFRPTLSTPGLTPCTPRPSLTAGTIYPGTLSRKRYAWPGETDRSPRQRGSFEMTFVGSFRTTALRTRLISQMAALLPIYSRRSRRGKCTRDDDGTGSTQTAAGWGRCRTTSPRRRASGPADRRRRTALTEKGRACPVDLITLVLCLTF